MCCALYAHERTKRYEYQQTISYEASKVTRYAPRDFMALQMALLIAKSSSRHE